MLFVVSSAPSSYSRLGLDIIHAIARHHFGRVETVQAGSLDAFYQAYKLLGGAPAVVSLSGSDPRMIELFRRTQSKILMFGGGFAETVALSILRRKVDAEAAVRAATGTFAEMAGLCDAASVVVYAWPDDDALLLPLIQSVALFYGLEPDGGLVEAVAAGLGLDRITQHTPVAATMRSRFPGYGQMARTLEEISDRDLRILVTAAEAYEPMAGGKMPKAMRWPAEATIDRSASADDGNVQMLGRAKRLAGGPAYSLPPGRWLMEVVFRLTANLSGNEIGVKTLVGRRHGEEVRTGIVRDGQFSATMAFEVERPNQPVSVIVKSLEGAIEGEIRIETIRLARTSASHSLPATAEL